MKQGIDCSLTLPHKKGRVTTVFKLVTPNARQSLSVASPPKPGLRRSSRKGRRGKKEERRVILVNMEISVILGHEKTKICNIIYYGKIDIFSVRTNIHIKNKMMGHLI